ncbi:MAG TPA: protein bax [Proteus sp.]|uniref:protein bax n=1 Tax=Proteus hauseri TaxID=183417 RepID=UPI000EC62C55|nr:protein bax [Proteus hauseri]QAV22708.1 protein bax [Proteus hauseri]HCH51460.1 protein bax [Proteus sp. (in: enterobacteria)]
MPSQLMRTSAVFAFLISLLFTGVSFASTSTGSSHMLQEYSLKGVSTSLPDLRKYPSGTQRKKAFLNVIVPIIEQVNNKILQDREWLLAQRKAQHWGSADLKKLRDICQYYGITCTSPKKVNWDSLMARVDIVPTHFVATQAATESGWGTSKLAQQNNNLFGMRCASQSCNNVPGKTKGYAAYPDIEGSVIAYVRNLNTHRAYTSLRSSRAQQRMTQQQLDSRQLITDLRGYSELGSSYNDYLTEMFDSNKKLISQVQLQSKPNS